MKEFIGVVVWLAALSVIHNWLWGGYYPTDSGFIMLFIIDNVVLFVPIVVISFIGSLFKRKKNAR